MRAIERDWAGRAHGILTDTAHIAETGLLGTTHTDDQDASDLRWPGYLGSAFEPGTGVLVVYNIHREFRSLRLVDDPPGGVVDRLIDGTRTLAESDGSDSALAAYLLAHRPAYEVGLSGGWSVSRHLTVALSAVGVPLTSAGIRGIAYLNASCCQFPELRKEPNDSNRKEKLKRRCLRAHPMADVVGMLRPAIVLCASGQANRAIRRASSAVPVVFFNQNSGNLEGAMHLPASPVLGRGTPIAVWADALRVSVESARGRRRREPSGERG